VSQQTISQDTIAAIATPAGRGGVGIIRVSGPKAKEVATSLLGNVPKPRYATFLPFLDESGQTLDQGLALYFVAPHSFTGEDVLELQGHGGPVVMDLLLRRILNLGIRMAKPGEFSERAFLNDKLDLAQAEAVADLIDSGSEQAARLAMRSLQGDFSDRIHNLVSSLTHLRMYVEAAIDFPEEEVDFLSDGKVAKDLKNILIDLEKVLSSAKQGVLLKEGMRVVIAGKPNAGKSSLLNKLSGQDTAIVTDIPGTTRDVLSETIQIDGMPLHIVDTAGLRISEDKIEMEGIKRAESEIEKADRVLLVVDKTKEKEEGFEKLWPEKTLAVPDKEKVTVIYNKVDLINDMPLIEEKESVTRIYLSAKTGNGLDLLREHLKTVMGYSHKTEGGFIARRRHLDALNRAKNNLLTAEKQFHDQKAGELLAEDLKLAQESLGEITGTFRPDDLLGKIFGSFCIGK